MEEGEDCVFDRVRQHLGRVHHVLVSEFQLCKHHLTHLACVSPSVPHAEACQDTHASSSWGHTRILGIFEVWNQRAVSGWLCKSVCGCLSLYCYDGTEVFEKNRRLAVNACGMFQRTGLLLRGCFFIAFSADLDGWFMEIQLLIQGSALSQMFFL